MTPQWKRTNATLHDKETYGAHDIRNMADARPARRTEVQHLRAGRNEDLVQATQHARSQLAPERIPHAIFDLRAVRTAIVDRDALLAAANQSAALIPVLVAAGVLGDDMRRMLDIAVRGLTSAALRTD